MIKNNVPIGNINFQIPIFFNSNIQIVKFLSYKGKLNGGSSVATDRTKGTTTRKINKIFIKVLNCFVWMLKILENYGIALDRFTYDFGDKINIMKL